MGFYLNSIRSASLYANEIKKRYFVDKTDMIGELIPLVESGTQYVCITRPRRFGKTIMANMIGAYFGKNGKGAMFDSLKIADDPRDGKHRNRHNVIYINFSEAPDAEELTYGVYIKRIKSRLIRDLRKGYPECEIDDDDSIWDILNDIYDCEKSKFIFVFDEWDYIFHRDYITPKDKQRYINFLHNLLKDQPYVELAYMTGILPIAQYSSGSGLNMFREYTMSTQHMYGTYFGFTDDEVDMLYGRYLENTSSPSVTREGLRYWYDGYTALVNSVSGKTVYINDEKLAVQRMYNPRSVVCALENEQLADYWTSSGPYDEIFYYVKNNIAGVRDDIAKMIAGESVKADIRQHASTSTEIKTRDQIFSAMVVYGFLTAEGNMVRIPNKELMDKFVDMVKKENSLGYVYNPAKESERMLAATKAGDTATMTEIMQQAHDTETGMLGYNNEAELSAIVKLVYLAARDDYDMAREDKAGVGYVDYIFKPKNDMTDDCIIVELKVDATADEAIAQIKSRNYALTITGKVGESPRYSGRILAVGITYFRNDKSKKHQCKVEVLREKL